MGTVAWTSIDLQNDLYLSCIWSPCLGGIDTLEDGDWYPPVVGTDTLQIVEFWY